MWAPITTASSRSFGSTPAITPITLRLATARSLPVVRTVTVVPGSARGAA